MNQSESIVDDKKKEMLMTLVEAEIDNALFEDNIARRKELY